MAKRVVELGHELYPEMFTWPLDGPRYTERKIRSREGDDWGYQYTEIQMTTHMGTHCDAPTHFSTGDQSRSLSWFRDEELVRPGVVLNVPKEPRTGITAEDCERALEEYGRELPERPTFLLHTGFFGEHGSDYDTYLNQPVYVAESGARWLVDHGAAIVGIDSSGFEEPGKTHSSTTVAHNTLLGAGVLLVEELQRMEEVVWPDPLVVVAPLPVRGGDGAPCRVFAIEV
jgi:arylformamidase